MVERAAAPPSASRHRAAWWCRGPNRFGALSGALLGVLLAACAAPAAPAAPPPPAPPASAPASAPTSAPVAVAPTSAPTAPPAPAQPPPVERVVAGIVWNASDAGIILAEARGYFRDQGIQQEPVQIQSATEAIALLAVGQMDVAGGGPGLGLYNAALQGSRVKVVADKGHAADNRFGMLPFLVRKSLVDSGEFSDWADLRGRTIALAGLTSGNRTILYRALQRGGLTEADVNIVQIAFPDMVPALANGSIDAGIGNEPSATAGVDRGIAARVASLNDLLPGYQSAMILYSEQFADTRTDAARRWMIAYLRGVRDYNDAFIYGRGKAEVVQALIDYTSVKDPDIYDRILLPGLDPEGHINAPTMEEEQRVFQQLGLLRQTVDMNTIVDTRFVDYARSVLGPYQPPK